MIKKILIVVVVLVAVFVVIVAMRPNEFRITRSTIISAPPPVVFAEVNNLRNWNAWSPWAKLDPNAKETFSGPEAGVGASFAWAGNKEVGEGSMMITESKPNERILLDLKFLKPFEATNLTEFTFRPEGDQTVVTWAMSGQNNFLFKAVGLFMDCSKMVGAQFEKGLAQLKAVAEGKK